MKKTMLFLAVVLLSLTAVVSCSPKLKNATVLVQHEVTVRDTLIGFVGTIGEDSMLFSIADARFNNGLMLPGDSVIVDYIDGRDDTLRALVVTVLPKVKPFAEPLKTDTLITAPADEKLRPAAE